MVIADIGSGNGASRIALNKAGIKLNNIFEVEPNKKMRELSRVHGGQNIISGNAANTLLPKNKFDIVTFFNSVHQASRYNNV